MNKKSFYPKIAFSNIKKNAKIYVPYMLMGIFVITMYYMMLSIMNNKSVNEMEHGQNIVMLINVGVWVERIFSVIFLFYINSFLMKRRKKEIGLYNILGMEKRHIGIIMFFENLYIMIINFISGIVLGIVFGKLMFLSLFKLIHADSVPAFDVQLSSVCETVIFFGIIFIVILFYNLAKIHMSNPIELLRGTNTGEREPKTKIITTIIGFLTLGGGYYFALTTKNAIQAMGVFLIAVIAVIIGTYCLFTSGSIWILKLLKKNKKFYYNAKHFTSVSSMLYRMKQNAIGLANICILSTMVLISVATTICMYGGMEDSINTTYPRQICTTSHIDSTSDRENILKAINEKMIEKNINQENVYENISIIANGFTNDAGEFEFGSGNSYVAGGAYFDFCNINEFNHNNNSNYALSDGEVLIYTNKKGYNDSVFNFNFADNKKMTFNVKQILPSIDKSVETENYLEGFVDYYVIVVNDYNVLDLLAQNIQKNKNIVYSKSFDTNMSKQDNKDLCVAISDIKTDNDVKLIVENKDDMRVEFQQMYGGFLFLGLFVGILFSMATALIIYYKQISEGYDDKERFIIMQKVGMSHAEVKKSIRSQVLIVFFLPLVVATIHVIASFKIIKQILKMLMMTNAQLFVWCTVITVVVFAIIYGLVFMATARSYYKITEF